MKHAIIILAHNEPEHLIKLVSYFEKDCYVLIHIDKKSSFEKKYIDQLNSMPQVTKVYRKYSVHWGGFSILQCELFMFREAVKIKDASYFHLLSGQDYPVKPFSVFRRFFENSDRDYMSVLHLPHERWDNNTFSRFRYYYFHDYVYSSRKSKFLAKLTILQKKLGIHRSIPNQFQRLYGGSQWMSLTRQSVDVLLTYTKRYPSFYRRMHFTFASDEIYIQTVLKNILDQSQIVPFNKRFIRYYKENGSKPANLDCNHIHLFLEQDVLFVRKMASDISNELVSVIDNRILTDLRIEITPTGAWKYSGFLNYHFNYHFFDFLRKYIVASGVKDGADFGCGIGLYVLNLCLMGFNMHGFDGNKHVRTQTRILFPEKHKCCECLDLTDNWDKDIRIPSFDLVLCLDVLTYIPEDLRKCAINNLMKHTNKSLIVSLNSKTENLTELVETIQGFASRCFIFNRVISNMCMTDSADSMIYMVFEKRKSSDKMTHNAKNEHLVM